MPVMGPISSPPVRRHRPAYRVLLIECRRDSAKQLAWNLEFHGYRTEVACQRQEAAVKARGFRPDAVLIDMSLPEDLVKCMARSIAHEAPQAQLIAMCRGPRLRRTAAIPSAQFSAVVADPPDAVALDELLHVLLSRQVMPHPGMSAVH